LYWLRLVVLRLTKILCGWYGVRPVVLSLTAINPDLPASLGA